MTRFYSRWSLGFLAMSLACLTGALPAQESALKLDDLKWMAGSWSLSKGGTTTEEHWIAPKGGLMLGINRTTREKGKTSFEFLRIQEKDGDLAYLAQPQGQKETLFPLKSQKANEVTFENPRHDFPQRIVYRLNERGQLVARIEGEIGGKAKSKEWIWDKVSGAK